MKEKIIEIGVIGCGTVGFNFIKSFTKKRREIEKKTGVKFVIKKVYDKDEKKIKPFPEFSCNSVKEIIEDPEIDIVVELIGGIHPAYEFIVKSNKNGKSVITANKALLSEKGKEIFNLAVKNKVYVGYEASVAGAIPVIKTLKESFIGNKITKMLGILNGTTNFILSQMFKYGMNFSDALKKAQKLGYAEADPTLDIGGMDTAHKLSILSTLAFNKPISWKDIYVEGIDKIEFTDIKYAHEFGYRIKLLAIAKISSNFLELRVHPALLPSNHLLSSVEGVYNGIFIEGDMIGNSLLYGEGAGGKAAASSVISDVVEIGKKILQKEYISPPFYENKKLTIKSMDKISIRYYFRFTALDKPGVLAKISKILGKNNISISSVIQKQENPQKAVPIVMLTHKAEEKNVKKAIKEIDNLDVIKKPTIIIRVEE